MLTPAGKAKQLAGIKSRQRRPRSCNACGTELPADARPWQKVCLHLGHPPPKIHRGVAPPHDGRLDGHKFWWESTLNTYLATHGPIEHRQPRKTNK